MISKVLYRETSKFLIISTMILFYGNVSMTKRPRAGEKMLLVVVIILNLISPFITISLLRGKSIQLTSSSQMLYTFGCIMALLSGCQLGITYMVYVLLPHFTLIPLTVEIIDVVLAILGVKRGLNYRYLAMAYSVENNPEKPVNVKKLAQCVKNPEALQYFGQSHAVVVLIVSLHVGMYSGIFLIMWNIDYMIYRHTSDPFPVSAIVSLIVWLVFVIFLFRHTPKRSAVEENPLLPELIKEMEIQ